VAAGLMAGGAFIQDAPRRVVITGVGVIAANGSEPATFWRTIRDGASAADFLTRFDVANIPSKVGAEVRDFDPEHYMDRKVARRLDRALQFSVAAARQAVRDAGIDFANVDADRCGVAEGTSMSNNEAAWETKDAFLKRGYRAVSVSGVISGAAGAGSGEVAHELGVKGHAVTICSSSASGNDAIGYAFHMVRSEEVDVMIAGGAEAPLIESAWGGLCANRVMTRHCDEPKRAMRPFDKTRDGFVLGEGAGYVILEELSHALGRGAKIYAELVAHGRSCEAYHPLAPHPDGIGYHRAIEKALKMAGIAREEVDYINAHGTATPANDVVETKAIKRFFGEHSRRLSISSTKPITGHLMGGAGALEAVVCALAIDHAVIPPTANLREPDPECDLDYVPLHPRAYPIDVVLNLNSGFGGKNSCMVLRRYPPSR
jgi:3-oxoacyl-[acyl-carrier-protein] synthase II